LSDEDIGDLGLDDGQQVVDGEEAADFKNNLAKMDPQDVFAEFDTDGSGNISFEEFRAMLPRLGIKMSVPKMLKYFRMCDADGSGEIDFTEVSDRGNTKKLQLQLQLQLQLTQNNSLGSARLGAV